MKGTCRIRLPHLMEQRYVQNGREGDIGPGSGLEDKPVGPWRRDDELFGAEERAEVLVEVLFLQPAAAVRARPKVHRVGREPHVLQTQAADHYKHDAHQDHQQGPAHTERAPTAEDMTEEILKALAERLATRHVAWNSQ